MRPARPAARASLLATALAALLLAPAAAAVAAPALEVRDSTVSGGAVTLTVAATGLPDGSVVDPATVTLSSGGTTWDAPVTVRQDGARTQARRAVLVVDTSGSMGEADIAAIRGAARSFLDVAPGDVAVGVVAFSTQARVLVEPTTDRTSVLQALGGLRGAGDTALYDGVLLALDLLGTDGERTLVVLGDGEDNASTATFDAARTALAASGARSDVVAFATERTRVDVLDGLAQAAGTTPVQASDPGQLAEAFTMTARDLVNQVTVTAPVPEGVRGDTEIQVALTAAGTALTAGTTLSLPEAAATPAPAPPAAAPSAVAWRASWALPTIVAGAFLALFLLFVVLLDPGTWRASTSARRTQEVQRYGLATPASSTVSAAPGAVSQAALAWADRRVQQRGVDGSWQLLLDRAALPLKAHEWLIIRLAAALAGSAAAAVVLPWWLLTAPLLGLVAWLVTGTFLRLKARSRANRFATHLPDVLQLVAGSLSSGFSFPQAIDNAATEGPDPVSTELAKALGAARLGIPLEDALDRVSERMDSTDLAWTVMTVRISREVGGNLAEVLLNTAETMRERGRLRRQVRTLSAEGRLSAYILVALPIGITAFLSVIRPEYLAPLVHEPLGWVLTGAAVLLVAIGAWWMSRLVAMEV